MKKFDALVEKITQESFRTGLAKGIGMVGKVLSFPRRLDAGAAEVLKGYTHDVERRVGGKAYGAPVGDPSVGKSEDFSDLEKELMLLYRKLKLTPRDPRLIAKIEELKKKIMKTR